MAMTRHPLTDQVLVVLKRKWPEEVDKVDLIDQSGLTPADLSEVLDQLRRDGELDESGEGYAWINPEDPDGLGVTEPAPGEDEPSDEASVAERLNLPDHSGRQVQVTFTVTGSFVPDRGASDDAITTKTARIATEIGNVLGTALPSLGANVGVAKVQIYDQPRVVFDAEAALREDPDSD